jgi:hypothetical protein
MVSWMFSISFRLPFSFNLRGFPANYKDGGNYPHIGNYRAFIICISGVILWIVPILFLLVFQQK